MIGLFYDTETTGLPLFHDPSEDPRQPHIVQLAAAQVDMGTGEVVSSMDVVVRPSGWTIPDEVTAIHGITTERARLIGVSESLAIEMLCEMWTRSSIRVAHNEQFDARIVRIGLKRHAKSIGLDADQWKSAPAECTQRMSTPILQLPPTEKMRAVGRNHFKSANLREAYKHFTGQDLVGAHTAIVDVRACIRVYFAIKAMAQAESVA